MTEGLIRLANEFTEVVVERVQTRNGARLRISVPSSGHQILLCPIELEALTWQDHELFSRLLRTPTVRRVEVRRPRLRDRAGARAGS
ncbi:MAG TPA: hypothetical protein VK280_30680 [Streptosporangiaceae bacterium]|nr:hypothetical protein [Streptosporangiaceae bacterium]